MWMISSIRQIPPLLRPSLLFPCLPSSKRPLWIHMMGRVTPMITLPHSRQTMHLKCVLDEIMYRAFSTTLKGPAIVWFGKLPPNTITSFQELSKLFVNNFVGRQRQKRSLSNLLSIEQGENKSLRSFIIRFNREALLVNDGRQDPLGNFLQWS